MRNVFVRFSIWFLLTTIFLSSSASGATVKGDLRGVGNGAINLQVNIQRLGTNMLSQGGSNVVVGPAINIVPTNGIFQTNLVSARFKITIGTYSSIIAVPGTDTTNWFNALVESGTETYAYTNANAFFKVAVTQNDTTPGFLSEKIAVSGGELSTNNPAANEKLLITVTGGGGSNAVAAGSNVTIVTNVVLGVTVYTVSASLGGGTVTFTDVTNVVNALIIKSNLVNLAQLNAAILVAGSNYLTAAMVGPAGSNFISSTILAGSNYVRTVSENSSAASISAAGALNVNTNFINPTVLGTLLGSANSNLVNSPRLAGSNYVRTVSETATTIAIDAAGNLAIRTNFSNILTNQNGVNTGLYSNGWLKTLSFSGITPTEQGGTNVLLTVTAGGSGTLTTIKTNGVAITTSAASLDFINSATVLANKGTNIGGAATVSFDAVNDSTKASVNGGTNATYTTPTIASGSFTGTNIDSGLTTNSVALFTATAGGGIFDGSLNERRTTVATNASIFFTNLSMGRVYSATITNSGANMVTWFYNGGAFYKYLTPTNLPANQESIVTVKLGPGGAQIAVGDTNGYWKGQPIVNQTNALSTATIDANGVPTISFQTNNIAVVQTNGASGGSISTAGLISISIQTNGISVVETNGQSGGTVAADGTINISVRTNAAGGISAAAITNGQASSMTFTNNGVYMPVSSLTTSNIDWQVADIFTNKIAIGTAAVGCLFSNATPNRSIIVAFVNATNDASLSWPATVIWYGDPVLFASSNSTTFVGLNTIDGKTNGFLIAGGRASSNFTAYAAGTAYSLTATPALLDFGTTDPTITINTAGTYLIQANVGLKYNGATFGGTQTATLKLRKTSGTPADITSGSRTLTLGIVTGLTGSIETTQVPPVIFTAAAGDIVQVFGSLSATPSAGTVDTDSAEIIAVRLK